MLLLSTILAMLLTPVCAGVLQGVALVREKTKTSAVGLSLKPVVFSMFLRIFPLIIPETFIGIQEHLQEETRASAEISLPQESSHLHNGHWKCAEICTGTVTDSNGQLGFDRVCRRRRVLTEQALQLLAAQVPKPDSLLFNVLSKSAPTPTRPQISRQR